MGYSIVVAQYGLHNIGCLILVVQYNDTKTVEVA